MAERQSRPQSDATKGARSDRMHMGLQQGEWLTYFMGFMRRAVPCGRQSGYVCLSTVQIPFQEMKPPRVSTAGAHTGSTHACERGQALCRRDMCLRVPGPPPHECTGTQLVRSAAKAICLLPQFRLLVRSAAKAICLLPQFRLPRTFMAALCIRGQQAAA